MEKNKALELAQEVMNLYHLANRDASTVLRSGFERKQEAQRGSRKFASGNYITEVDGDLYYLEKWANDNVRYWGNGEVASVVYGGKNYAHTTARRIKLDVTLSKKETELAMVVDGWEDEEAGYMDYHFELDEEGVEL